MQVNADLDAMEKYHLTSKRRSISYKIQKLNSAHMRQVAEDARNGPSFKSFLSGHRANIENRIWQECKMLDDAFRHRSWLDYHNHYNLTTAATCANIISVNNVISENEQKSDFDNGDCNFDNSLSIHRQWIY